MIGFISCDNNEIVSTSENANNSDVLSLTRASQNLSSNLMTEDLNFLYKGVRYHATCVVEDDSIISIDNKDVDQLFAKFDSMPELGTVLYPDGSYEYFDNQEDFNLNLKRVIAINESMSFKSFISSRGELPLANKDYDANLFLFDDRNYSDSEAKIYLDKGKQGREIEHLKPEFGMNDKTSSFVAYSNIDGNMLFELYEDDNYRNHCFRFIISNGTNEVINSGERFKVIGGKVAAPNLKNVHVRTTKRSSWNDRITSVRITRL